MITQTHTRLLKSALEVDDSRAYWHHRDPATPAPAPTLVLTDLWFGPKSLPRITNLLATFRQRYDAYPDALSALHTWSHRAPASLAAAAPLICHWHTLVTDPLYRHFTLYLAERRASQRPTITRPLTLAWLDTYPDAAPWTVSTRVQFASKLLSAAYAAGLVTSNSDRNPRPLAAPVPSPDALTYALHLARHPGVDLDPTDNPLLASLDLHLADGSLDVRLRRTSAVTLARSGALVDLTFRDADLTTWATTLAGAHAA